MRLPSILTLVFVLVGCGASASSPGDQPDAAVRTGADVLVADNFALLAGKRVGIVTNHTALVGDRHLVDLMHESDQVDVVALFGPEHGIRGDDVGRIDDAVDERTGLPAYSLYGEIRQPTAEMLEGIDVLVFDIQDIGPRFYTYISTMGLTMQSAAEHGLQYVVLDRPNPIGGVLVEGFVRDDGYDSFVGFFAIPVTHGLTVGELAIMAKEERMIEGLDDLDLHVVQVEGWTRNMLWPDYGSDWVRPSPNIPDFATALIYPGACFFEGTTASEGRGTQEPFILLGAPWADGQALAADLNSRNLPGLRFDGEIFTPESLPGMSPNPKHLGTELQGIRYNITDAQQVRPVEAGIHVLHAFYSQANEEQRQDFFRRDRMNRLAGTGRLVDMLEAGKSADEIIASWQDELTAYDQLRRGYHLYD
jgi:uncharacterized protein YbbC (DUF1343 family)